MNLTTPPVSQRLLPLLSLFLLGALPLSAQDAADTVAPADVTWILLCAALVFFMQAGFALLELGMTRAKNCINVAMKNVLDFCVASVCFFLFGFSLMFANSNGWFSKDFIWLSSFGENHKIWIFWVFQVVFAGTAATIISGAIAERTKFVGYLIFTILISGVIYPILGHWAWGSFGGAWGAGSEKGWLEAMGFIDFAGSTVVHGIGGACALAGVIVVGPRTGRFMANGRAYLIPGHNIPLAVLGAFILFFGWFGFNAGSALAANMSVARITVNTILAASSGGLIGMCVFWKLEGKPEVGSVLNSILAGLVAITACCHCVSPVSALIIGGIAGVISSCGTILMEKLRLDDVVGAVPVHLLNGIWGTLCVALFYEKGFSLSMLGVQALGTFAITGAAFIASFTIFKLIDKFVGLRATDEEQKLGLDFAEHASNAYPYFTSKE
jgi:Amt family ammonium transporter